MMYDMRTSTLRPGTVEEFEARFAQRHPYREKHAQLGAFWHTEFGPLNQVMHVWLYETLHHRQEAREAAARDPDWQRLPGGRAFMVSQASEMFIPALCAGRVAEAPSPPAAGAPSPRW